MIKTAAAIILSIGTVSVISAERPVAFDDLYNYPQLEAISLSPDGKFIAAEITEYDLDDDESFSDIWLISIDGGEVKRLTNSGEDSDPQWSPDGNIIAFISGRSNADEENTKQVWLIDPSGGEAYQLTGIYTGADSPVWSGSGEFLLINSSVYPDCETDDCNRERVLAKDNSKVKAELYDQLLFRHYKYWSDGTRNHIFLVDAATGEHTDLTPLDEDAPSIALSGGTGYAFSGNRDEIAFVMNTDTVVAISTNNDIFTLNVATRHLTRISTSPGNDEHPLYSPDGRYIAYRSMARAGYESDQKDIILYDKIRNTRENLTESFDRCVGEFIWGPYSKYIYFTAIDAGLNKIYKLNLEDRKTSVLVDDGVCYDLCISGNGLYLYYLKSTGTQPYEIYEYNSKNKRQTRLTFLSDSLFKELALSAAEDFWFPGARDDSVRGSITLPPDFDRNYKYPLVLLIHGGPQWCWLNEFNYYGWNTQLMAAQGYVTLQIDPHGSKGYGQAFVDAVNNDWGGVPYQDLMLGLDYVISKHDYIDTTRLAALGRSYGGYMINWICGQTDRFKCLISVDGDFDNESAYYSTEELWFNNWEFGGPPWQYMENYLKHSPSEYVENFKTPTLVVHGQLDYRVDISQGIMMFTALQTRNVPSKFLYFPDEGHSVKKLYNIRYLYQVQLDWLARYLK